MKKRWLLWLVPVYLVGLVVFAPAQLLTWFVPAQAGVELSAVQGSLWQGQANVSYQTPRQQLQFQQVGWNLTPSALLTGKVVLALEIPAVNTVSGNADVELSFAGALRVNGQFGGNLQQTISEYNIPALLTTDGRWDLAFDNYELADVANGRWCDALDADVTSRSTAVRIQREWIELGDFVTQLSCSTNSEIIARMSPNNRLGLEFTTTLAGTQQQPQVRIQGQLRPTTQTPRQVADVLIFLGEPNANGAYPFNFTL
ncbi:type II secretion system protein N [Pseudidiomarina salilacus]|uniref:type II secretion system protein N n=1 Tax=Pseudidiomarina salilacus TaxID=3384452 RepID=UPI00398494CB